MVKKVPADIKTDRLKKANKAVPKSKSKPEKKLKPSTSKDGTTSMDEGARGVEAPAQKPCSVEESAGGESDDALSLMAQRCSGPAPKSLARSRSRQVVSLSATPIVFNGSFNNIPNEHQHVRFLIPRLQEQRTQHAIKNKNETSEEYLLIKTLCLEAEIQELKLDNQDLRDKFGDMKEKVHSIYQVLTLFRDELGTVFPKGKVERDFNDIALFY